jgi:CBS-domain-containing membrane protein
VCRFVGLPWILAGVVARGKSSKTRIRDVMTTSTYCCPADADLADVERTMADHQVRRVIIVDDDQCCIGIVSQADVARAAQSNRDVSAQEVGRVLKSISEPRDTSSGSPPIA